LVLLIACALAAPPATAQTAGEVAADPELQKAYDDAFAAMMADPANLDKTFTFADIATRKGDLEGAISALERMLFINPDLPRVKLELGVLYYRLGSFETAKTYLQGALESPEVPPPVRERATSFLGEIDKRASVHQFTGQLYAGIRAQSNATASTGSGLVVTPLSPILGAGTLSSQFTKKGDINAFGIANLKYLYDFQDQNQDTMEVTGLFYGARQQEQTQVNVSYFELTAGPRLPLPSSWLWAGAVASVRPYAIFDYVDLRDDPYYRAPGAGFEFLTQVVPGSTVQINFEGRDKRYQDSVAFPTLKGQNGSELQVRGLFTQALTDQLALLVGGSYLKLNARDGTQAYTYYDYTGGLTFTFDAPFKLTELPWNLTGLATHAYYVYDRPDPTVDPDNTRFDRDWRFTAVGTVPLSDAWTLVTTLGRTVRQSSLPNFTYNNNYVSMSVGWRF
jgi:hypothetical protein